MWPANVAAQTVAYDCFLCNFSSKCLRNDVTNQSKICFIFAAFNHQLTRFLSNAFISLLLSFLCCFPSDFNKRNQGECAVAGPVQMGCGGWDGCWNRRFWKWVIKSCTLLFLHQHNLMCKVNSKGVSRSGLGPGYFLPVSWFYLHSCIA